MRIVCEQCQTKYVVPDEKIVKNVLRLTCQKCGHVITTRVDEAVQNEKSTPGTLNKWRASIPNTPARMQSETPTWYYSYNGESFGPFTELELKEKLLSAKMAPIVNRCYLWKKSFTDWKPVLEVEPFASALLMPPPPSPPPAPAPVKEDESLPPLFSSMAGASSTSSSGVRAVGKNDADAAPAQSSPDLSGLKLKLSAASAGSMPDRQRESLAKLAMSSNAFGTAPACSPSNETSSQSGDTKIKSPSPLLSFQSLDAITPDIKTEDSSGNAAGLARPFPSLSGVAPIARTADGAKSSFTSMQIKPSIASILGTKTSDAASSSIPSAASGVKFSGLKEASSAKALVGLKTPGLNTSSPAAPSSISGQSGFPLSGKLASVPLGDSFADMKDEIGDIVRQGADHLEPNEPGNESVSQWLPSQSELRDESGLSLTGMSQLDKVIDESSAQVSLPDIDLNIHGPESICSEKVSLPAIDMSVSCASVPAIEPVDAQKDAGGLVDIDLNDMSELDSELLSDIDLDDDSSQFFDRNDVNDAVKNGAVSQDAADGIPERDSSEPMMLSGAAMLAMVPGHKPAEIKSTDSNSVDLDEIDLDDENSNLIAPDVVKDAEKAEDVLGISGLGAANELFASQAEDDGVARVSKTKLDEIKERHSDLFAEFDEAPSSQEDDVSEGVSENSMMIQLAHIQKMDQKEKRKSRIGLIVAICVFAVIIVGASVGGIVLQDSEKDEVAVQPGFAAIGGQVISSDDLDVQVPDDDFEIVEVPVQQQKARAHREETKKAPSKGSATEKAAEAIYGSKDENKEEPDAQEPAVREDGRAKVALNRTDDFAKTAGIQGSKYVKGASGSSRDSLKIGLAVVGRSVQDCARRAAKNGTALPQKIYIHFNIEPEGNVSSYKIADEVPENFNKCLDSKRDTWKFAPFDGDTVSIRQAFILG